MSRIDFFPFLDDKGLDAFDNKASAAEKEELRSLFRVARVENPKPARHVVAASLFWKPAATGDGTFPAPTRELLKDPLAHGIMGRVNQPWTHYVEPLLKGAAKLTKERPQIAFRVYLAQDLAFLIPDLTAVGCEVALMESSSLAHNPGAMWRFLAMEHEGLVTITDSDQAQDVIHDVERTELVAEAGLGHWRVAYTWGTEETRKALASHYRPILACQFGSTKSYPMTELMAAFIWHYQKGTMRTTLELGEETLDIFGSRWPDYGFDEWFLLAAMLPRLAFEGVLSFVPWEDRSLNHWFALDVEYCTWANPKSEIMYHKNSPMKKIPQLEKKKLWADEKPLVDGQSPSPLEV